VCLHIILDYILGIVNDNIVETLDVSYVPPKSIFVLFCVCEQLTWLNSTANPISGVMGTNPSSLLLVLAGLLGVCHACACFVAKDLGRVYVLYLGAPLRHPPF